MEIEYSKHWIKKQKSKKKDINNDAIEFAIKNSKVLKVVYKKLNQKIFIITSYWLD